MDHFVKGGLRSRMRFMDLRKDDGASQDVLDVSVVICAYSSERLEALLAAIDSVRRQSVRPIEIIVVIDHNASLLDWIRVAAPDVTVIENIHQKGLSGARNSGVARSRGSIVAFIDDDARAEPDWLETLLQAYRDPAVVGVGGRCEADWEAGKPGWFPEEFAWVVGSSYRGLPEEVSPARNLFGCNMSFRRSAFDVAGGFRLDMGRVGKRPVGCEETEFCIRLSQRWTGGVLILQPRAIVWHAVPAERSRLSYFLSRCHAEGLSKALVAQLVGEGDGLASERAYTLKTLPAAIGRGAADALLRRDPSGLARSLAIVAGLTFTVAGYLQGRAAPGAAPVEVTAG